MSNCDVLEFCLGIASVGSITTLSEVVSLFRLKPSPSEAREISLPCLQSEERPILVLPRFIKCLCLLIFSAEH